jgi:hypothetical protein
MAWSVHIGPISEGTLRNEDLIPEFLDELGNLNKMAAMVIEKDFNYDEDFDYDSENASDMVNALMEKLNEYCPLPFVHFGSTEGDGACFGWWPEVIQEIIDFEEGVIVFDHKKATPQYALDINDHGNVTLYEIELREVWSIV